MSLDRKLVDHYNPKPTIQSLTRDDSFTGSAHPKNYTCELEILFKELWEYYCQTWSNREDHSGGENQTIPMDRQSRNTRSECTPKIKKLMPMQGATYPKDAKIRNRTKMNMNGTLESDANRNLNHESYPIIGKQNNLNGARARCNNVELVVKGSLSDGEVINVQNKTDNILQGRIGKIRESPRIYEPSSDHCHNDNFDSKTTQSAHKVHDHGSLGPKSHSIAEEHVINRLTNIENVCKSNRHDGDIGIWHSEPNHSLRRIAKVTTHAESNNQGVSETVYDKLEIRPNSLNFDHGSSAVIEHLPVAVVTSESMEHLVTGSVNNVKLIGSIFQNFKKVGESSILDLKINNNNDSLQRDHVIKCTDKNTSDSDITDHHKHQSLAESNNNNNNKIVRKSSTIKRWDIQKTKRKKTPERKSKSTHEESQTDDNLSEGNNLTPMAHDDDTGLEHDSVFGMLRFLSFAF